VVGKQNDVLMEECYLKKIYSDHIEGEMWGAIQITTANSLAAIVNIVLANPGKYHGFIQQESFDINDITKTTFGKIYEPK
jgi:saccharopine dehydrogenase-like NADP-dependent oxidoreductase